MAQRGAWPVQVLVYGEGHDEAGFGAKKPPAAGKKRPNPEEEAALQEAMAGTDYKVPQPVWGAPVVCLAGSCLPSVRRLPVASVMSCRQTLHPLLTGLGRHRAAGQAEERRPKEVLQGARLEAVREEGRACGASVRACGEGIDQCILEGLYKMCVLLSNMRFRKPAMSSMSWELMITVANLK